MWAVAAVKGRFLADGQTAVPHQTRQAGETEADDRWPLPYAIMFFAAASMALWGAIIGVAIWLFG
jgi:hypothetical protein